MTTQIKAVALLVAIHGAALAQSLDPANPNKEYIRLGDRTIATETPPPQTAAPTFSPVATTYWSPQTVTLSTATSGATIRFTLDGTTPTTTYGNIGTTANISASNTTLKAIAYLEGLRTSSVSTGVYVISTVVAAPSFTPAAGTYHAAQTVTLSTPTPGATIRYTLDGSTPTSTYGTLGTSVAVSTGCTLKAIAYATGLTTSSVSSGAYVLQAETPTFSLAAGTYSGPQTATITSPTPGASFRYTLDGTTPTSTYGTIGSSVTVNSTATLRAVAYTATMIASPVASAAYIINPFITGPEDVFVNSSITYQVAGRGNLTGSVEYNVDWGDGDTSGWFAANSDPSQAASVSHTWTHWTYMTCAHLTVQARSGSTYLSPVSSSLCPRVHFLDYHISSTSLNVGDAFSIWFTTDYKYLGSSFNLCVSNNGYCWQNYGTIDSNGYWGSGTMYLYGTYAGTYGEYITVPGVAGHSNFIYFTVNPYATYNISNSNLHVGDQFSLWVNSNIPNADFLVYVWQSGWSAYLGTTDMWGGWSSGTWIADSGSIGSWTEWLIFPDWDGYTSNTIYLTVSN